MAPLMAFRSSLWRAHNYEPIHWGVCSSHSANHYTLFLYKEVQVHVAVSSKTTPAATTVFNSLGILGGLQKPGPGHKVSSG